jgi:hypothetical protein
LAVIDVLRFRNAYFCNGRLEIYNAESNALLSRKDAYIPKNMMFNEKGARAETEHWEKLAAERRKTEQAGAGA